MTTITIENVPDNVVKRLWNKVSFTSINITKKRVYTKKDPTIMLQKLVDDPENISYGPFEWEEVSNYLKGLMKKLKLQFKFV